MKSSILSSGWGDLLSALQEFVSRKLTLGAFYERIQELVRQTIPHSNRFWLDFDVLPLSILCFASLAEIGEQEGEDPIEAAQFFLRLIENAISGQEPYEYGFIFGPEGEPVHHVEMPPNLAQIARLLEDVVENEIAATNNVTKATLARLDVLYKDLHATSLGATLLRNQCKAVLPGGIYEGFLTHEALLALLDPLPNDYRLEMNIYRLQRYRACKRQFYGLSSVALNVTFRGSGVIAFIEPVVDS